MSEEAFKVVSLAEPLLSNASTNPIDPSPSGTSAEPVRRSLVELLERESEVLPPQEKWEWLGLSAPMRRIRNDDAEFTRVLRTRFSEGALLKHRLLVRDKSGDVVLAPILGSRSPFMFWQDREGRVIDVISDRGSLWAADPLWLQLAIEQLPPNRSRQRLLLASIGDAQILQQLGLRVVPMSDWGDLTGSQFRRLLTPRAQIQRTHELIFVGWDVGGLVNSMPKNMTGAIRNLYDAATVYSTDPEAVVVKVWHPREANFEQIVRANRFQDRQAIKRLLCESIRLSRADAVTMQQRILDEQDCDLMAAIAGARRVILLSSDVPRSAEAALAAVKLRRAIAAVTSDAFLRRAAHSNDPVRSAVLLELVSLLDQHAHNNPLLRELAQISRNEHPNSASKVRPTAEEQDRYVTRFLKLAKALAH
jgi:hypothetical protein